MNRPKSLSRIIKHYGNKLLLFFVLLAVPFLAHSFGTQEDAARFFKKKQFVQALPLYHEFYRLYPNDPMFGYYYGICLTETGRFEDETRKILLSVALEDVPMDVLFYIGKNYHARNDFETAMIYYGQFGELSKKKDQRAVKLRKIRKLCDERINPFAADWDAGTAAPDTPVPEKQALPSESTQATAPSLSGEKTQPDPRITPPDTLIADRLPTGVENQEETSETENTDEEILHSLQDTFFHFVLTTEIYYQKIQQFRTVKGRAHFVQAWKNNREMEQSLEETRRLRKIYDETESAAFKTEISRDVIEREQKQLSLKSAIETDYLKARKFEMEYWNKASAEDFRILNAEKELYAPLLSAKAENKPTDHPVSSTHPETAENQNEIPDFPDDVSTQPLNPDDTIPAPQDEEITTDPAELVPEGPVFRIQIGAFTSEPPESVKSMYAKLSVIRKIDHFTDEQGITRYTIGETSRYSDALKLQEQIRQESVKDAFIIAFKNGKRISLKEALENEKK
ncbi:MAG TPA: SPOR domain-containing protein [Prolixibacteraceae bacterium]|nr:SPOR domain-containing protein [Prolixibacteraceae bacterium]